MLGRNSACALNNQSIKTMKKTLFITMLAAALMGSQVLAEDSIPTTVSNASLYYGPIYVGEYSGTDDVSGGAVTIQEDLVLGDDLSGCDVYGGRTVGDGKIATNNAVTMSGGQVFFLIGGDSQSGNAENNTVTISGGQVNRVYGAHSTLGVVTGNTVDMTGGYVEVDVYGGCTYSGGATSNTVTITDGYVAFDVYGGFVDDTGDATGNTVDMTGGEVHGTVRGGHTYSGGATDNTVTITDGYVAFDVYGGYVEESGDATGNTVDMTGGEVYGIVRGGCTYSGSATDNTVDMSGGYVEVDVYGGCTFSGDATGNTVNMSGGKVDGCAYGGYTASGNATANAVTIDGYVGHSVYGGSTRSGDATGNTVVLSGGEVTGGVVAGSGATGASYNHVYLVGKGASVKIGGQTYTGSAQGVMVGGVVSAGQAAGGATLSNNTIEIYGTGISVQDITDAQAVNYHITESLLSTADPMVTVTTQAGAFYLFSPWSNFIGDKTTDWTAFAGQSITLMQSELPIAIVTETDVDITDGEGNVLATATLTLGGPDDTSLYLTFGGGSTGPDALDVTLVNSLWASSAYVREFVRLSEAQGYALKAGDTAVWGGGFGTFMHVTGDKGFKSNGGGYGIGVNHAFSDNTQGGLSFGQGFGSYHNSGADGATVHQRAILAAATASTRIGKDFSLGGHLAYGSVRNRADCRLEGDSERARWNDNVFNLGARAAYDFHATEATAITPFLGLDWMYGAQESINGAYARHYSHGRLNELRMPVGVTVSTSAEVGSTKLLPQLSVAYVPSLAQQNPHANVSTAGADYRVKGYAPGRNAFMLNVGMNAIFSENWSAGASYTLETRRHAVDQSVNASVRYTF